MSCVAGQADDFAGRNVVTWIDQRPVLLEVVILAGCVVIVQDDNEVGEATAPVLPTTFRMGFLYCGNNAASRGMYRCALNHLEIDRILFQTGVAESRSISLQDAIAFTVCVRHQVDHTVVVVCIAITDCAIHVVLVTAGLKLARSGQRNQVSRFARE